MLTLFGHSMMKQPLWHCSICIICTALPPKLLQNQISAMPQMLVENHIGMKANTTKNNPDLKFSALEFAWLICILLCIPALQYVWGTKDLILICNSICAHTFVLFLLTTVICRNLFGLFYLQNCYRYATNMVCCWYTLQYQFSAKLCKICCVLSQKRVLSLFYTPKDHLV